MITPRPATQKPSNFNPTVPTHPIYSPTGFPVTSNPIASVKPSSSPVTLIPTTQSPVLTFSPSKIPSSKPSYLPSFLNPSNWPSLLPSRTPSIAPSLPVIQPPSWVNTTEPTLQGMTCITTKGTEVLVSPLLSNAISLQEAMQWLVANNITRSVLFLNSTVEIGKCIPVLMKACSGNSKLYEIHNPSSVITQIQASNPNVGLALLTGGNLCFFARASGNTTIAYTLAGHNTWYFSNFIVPDSVVTPSFLGIATASNDYHCFDNSTFRIGNLSGTNQGLSTPPFSVRVYGESHCLNSTILQVISGPVLLRSYALYKQNRCPARDVSSLGVWTTSDSSIAMILQNGTLIPLKPGNVKIYFFSTPCVSLSNKTGSQYELETTVANINTFTPINNVVYDLNFMVSMGCSANFVIQ